MKPTKRLAAEVAEVKSRRATRCASKVQGHRCDRALGHIGRHTVADETLAWSNKGEPMSALYPKKPRATIPPDCPHADTKRRRVKDQNGVKHVEERCSACNAVRFAAILRERSDAVQVTAFGKWGHMTEVHQIESKAS